MKNSQAPDSVLLSVPRVTLATFGFIFQNNASFIKAVVPGDDRRTSENWASNEKVSKKLALATENSFTTTSQQIDKGSVLLPEDLIGGKVSVTQRLSLPEMCIILADFFLSLGDDSAKRVDQPIVILRVLKCTTE